MSGDDHTLAEVAEMVVVLVERPDIEGLPGLPGEEALELSASDALSLVPKLAGAQPKDMLTTRTAMRPAH